MHSPETVAFEIYLGAKKKKNGQYRSPLITIWHNDPESDGTDDSCGWFMRERHFDKRIVEKAVKLFESEWDSVHKGENGFIYNCGWFNPQGENIVSVRGIVLSMYILAAKAVFDVDGKLGPGKMWKKAWKFVEKHYVRIMYFAENNIDSMRDVIIRKYQIGCNVEYTPKKRQEMIRECASIICADIVRKNRKWYQHPRWHIHHWSIQIHPIENLKRRFWDKCCICGKRGFKSSPMSDWNGTKRWHQECDNSDKNPVIPVPNP